jgi:hypothetical protein
MIDLAAVKRCPGDGSKCPACLSDSNGHGCEFAHADSFDCTTCNSLGVVLAHPELRWQDDDDDEIGLVVPCPSHDDPRMWSDGWCLRCSDNDQRGSGFVVVSDPATFVYRALIVLHNIDGQLVRDVIHRWQHEDISLEDACRDELEQYAESREES